MLEAGYRLGPCVFGSLGSWTAIWWQELLSCVGSPPQPGELRSGPVIFKGKFTGSLILKCCGQTPDTSGNKACAERSREQGDPRSRLGVSRDRGRRSFSGKVSSLSSPGEAQTQAKLDRWDWWGADHKVKSVLV